MALERAKLGLGSYDADPFRSTLGESERPDFANECCVVVAARLRSLCPPENQQRWEARTARTRDRIHSKVAGRSQVGIQRSNGCLPSEARCWAINAGHAADGSERSVAHSFAQTAPEALVSFGADAFVEHLQLAPIDTTRLYKIAHSDRVTVRNPIASVFVSLWNRTGALSPDNREKRSAPGVRHKGLLGYSRVGLFGSGAAAGRHHPVEERRYPPSPVATAGRCSCARTLRCRAWRP